MMKNRISPRDQEMLSAYLDGQLSSKDIARLQARLKDERQMQVALEELRMTREALRSLPRLRAPRSFTLTPEMVSRRTAARRTAAGRPAYPVFGFASLVASLLLVFVFVADRMSFANTAQTVALQNAAQSTQMEELVQTMVVEGLATEGVSAPEAEVMLEMEAPMAAKAGESSQMEDSAAAGSSEALTLPYPEPVEENFAASEAAASEPAASKIAPEETATPAEAIQQPAEALPATPTPTPTPWLINGTEVLGVGGGAPDTPRESYTPTFTPQPSETPEPSPTPSPTCTLEPSPLPTDTPLPSDTAADASEALQMPPDASESPLPRTSLESQAGAEQVEQPVPLRQPGRAWFLAVEIVLGLLAFGSAVIFFYLYRKSS